MASASDAESISVTEVPPAVVEATGAPLRRSSTKLPDSVPAMSNECGALPVRLSELLAPVSLVACKSGVPGVAAVLSIVTVSGGDEVATFPATSVCLVV